MDEETREARWQLIDKLDAAIGLWEEMNFHGLIDKYPCNPINLYFLAREWGLIGVRGPIPRSVCPRCDLLAIESRMTTLSNGRKVCRACLPMAQVELETEVVLVIDESGCDALYIDGKLATRDHALYAGQALDELQKRGRLNYRCINLELVEGHDFPEDLATVEQRVAAKRDE